MDIERLVSEQADPAPYRCPECGKPWWSEAVADDCCGDWLGYD